MSQGEEGRGEGNEVPLGLPCGRQKEKSCKKDDNLEIIPECHSARQRQRKSLCSQRKLSRVDRNGVEINCCSLKSYVIPFTSIISWRY